MASNIEKYNETLTKDELIERARNAGIKSGEARRKKRSFKDSLSTLLSLTMKAGDATDIEALQSMASLKGKNLTVQDTILLAQIKKAMGGDTTAAVYIRDTCGQRPGESVDVNMKLPVLFEGEDDIEE